MGDGNQSWEAGGNVVRRTCSIENVHPFTGSLAILGGGGLFRTPGCRRDTSGRSLLHDHFVSKDRSEEKEERQEKAYLGGI